MDIESSFTQSVTGGFVPRARWETRIKYNKEIAKEEDFLKKKFLTIKRDIKDAMYDFGEKL